MYTLQMRRYRVSWITTWWGSIAECRQAQMRWLEWGYEGETQIVAAR
jgi:hypothetical protein